MCFYLGVHFQLQMRYITTTIIIIIIIIIEYHTEYIIKQKPEFQDMKISCFPTEV